MHHGTVLGDANKKPVPQNSPMMHCQRRYSQASCPTSTLLICVCLYACLSYASVYLSACLSICISVCLFVCVCVSICMFVYVTACLYASIRLCDCLSIRLCDYPFIRLCNCLSICLCDCLSKLSVCVSVYLHVCLSAIVFLSVCVHISLNDVCLFIQFQARSWVSSRGVRRVKMLRVKKRAPNARAARGSGGMHSREILKMIVLYNDFSCILSPLL